MTVTKDKTTKDMADSVNEREIVLDILLELNRPEAMSHLVIGAALKKYQYLLKHQRSFITRLAQGTLERRIELDYIINQYSKTPVRKMKPLIRSLLEMSVYQLKYMDNVPVSAVCNEAVKLAGKRHFVNLKGFVNGVLRNIARNDCACEYPDQNKEPVKYLSVRYSMPEELVAFFKKQADDTTVESILAGFYKEKTTYIRCNTKKLTVEKFVRCILNTVKVSGSILFIIATSQVLGWILTANNIPQIITNTISSISDNPHVIFAIIILIVFVLGFFLVDAAIITLVTPLFYPLVLQAGIDPLAFAIAFNMCCILGGITPPVGGLLYLSCTIGEISVVKAIKAVWPFVLALLVSIVITMYVPILTNFIPNVLL